jgi:hypothetical protein
MQMRDGEGAERKGQMVKKQLTVEDTQVGGRGTENTGCNASSILFPTRFPYNQEKNLGV